MSFYCPNLTTTPRLRLTTTEVRRLELISASFADRDGSGKQSLRENLTHDGTEMIKSNGATFLIRGNAQKIIIIPS